MVDEDFAWRLTQGLVRIDSSDPGAYEDEIERFIKRLIEQQLAQLDSSALDAVQIEELDDLLTRLLNTTNELERNQLMQYLQDNSCASAFDKLDDETKLQLLKPRSIQSLDELSEFGDMLKSAIEQFNASSDPAPSDPAPSDPAPSDPAPSDSAPAS